MKKTKSNPKIKKALRVFIAGADRAFNAEYAAEEIARELKLDVGRIIPEIEGLLAEDSSLLDLTREDELRETYIPRRRFFDRAEFCISPTQDEIDRGILFPGHRFHPFLDQEILPFDVVLKPENSETEFKIKTVKDFGIEDLQLYHVLLGTELMLSYFILNDKSNVNAFDPKSGADVKLKMKVFDMKEFYKEHSFKLGDALLVSVESCDEGFFRFSVLPGSEKQSHFADIQNWVSKMENALMNVFDKFGPAIDIPSQFEQALMSEPSLMENVFISYGEFLKITQKISIKPFGTKTSVLWRNDENPVDSLNLGPNDFAISTGSVESLEKILREIGVSLTPHEIEAFMRDELYHGRKSLEAVSERCFSGRELIFSDEAQQVAFDNFMDELWEEVIEDYNRFTDETHGKLRAKALALVEEQMAFLRSLDRMRVMPDQLPREEMLSFSEISGVLSQLLDILNNAGNNIGGDEAGGMLEMLDQTVQTVAVIKASMKSKIPGLE
ncbi:MAG: hypothetical protein WCS96_10025 [Victivallales bacterium]